LTGDQQENKSILEGVFEGIDHLSHTVPGEDIRSAINDFQLKNDMNFLVMIKNKHTFMERLFLRSKIKQIGLHIRIPFMEIPCLPKN
ncbi:MAG: universal stress protein, partial [Eudoraea sp.]